MIFYYDDFKNIYKNRYEAIISPNPCWFYWYDKELKQLDWQTEPSESLQQLYKERAQWIRDNYEYVIVAYSGGIDSTNVLESFYYNNIHIDEILSIGALSQEYFEGTDENLCADLKYNVFSTLNKLNLPKTKITIEDYTKYLNSIDNFEILKICGTEWYKNIGSYYSIHNFFWNNLKNKYKDKKVGIVFGTDKPFVFEFNNKLYTQFNDRQIFDYGNIPYNGNFQRVNFYTSLQSTKLIKKQLYSIINFQKEYNKKNKINNKQLLTDEKIIKKIIYNNLKNPLIYQSKKSLSGLLSMRDMFILNKKNSDIYKIYNAGLKLFQKDVKININDLGFFRTKDYFLCDL